MLAVLAALTAGGIAVPLMAHAAATDVGAAVTDAQDVASATVNNAQQSLNDPNTTCTVKATGDNVVQRVNALVAEVFTEDAGTGAGSCASFDTSSYSATVTMNLQAFFPTSATAGSWQTFCSISTSANSIEGVAQPVPATRVCPIAAPSIYLNRYHRVQGVLTNTRGQHFYDYSPIWFDSP